MTDHADDDLAGTRTWRIGDMRVTRVVEMTMRRPLNTVLPAAEKRHWEQLDWLRPQFMDDNDDAILGVHCYILEVAGRVIVVDTCYGNDKTRRVIETGDRLSTDFLERFRGTGIEPSQVDTVVATHLHLDHVGWNTTLVGGAWIPTFPHARYLMDHEELEHWSRWTAEPGTVETDHVEVFKDSIAPILAAGLADHVAGHHEVAPGVDLVPTPGHTPGHVSVRIHSRGAEAWILGDAAHHPVQVAHPELGAAADVDPDRARQTREFLWRTFSDRPIVVLGSHWPGEPVQIVRDGSGSRVVPAVI